MASEKLIFIGMKDKKQVTYMNKTHSEISKM